MSRSLCAAAARELNQYVNSIIFRGDKKEMDPHNVVSFSFVKAMTYYTMCYIAKQYKQSF